MSIRIIGHSKIIKSKKSINSGITKNSIFINQNLRGSEVLLYKDLKKI